MFLEESERKSERLRALLAVAEQVEAARAAVAALDDDQNKEQGIM